MPQASILVPTHDHWATLPMAVGSVLRQTVPDLEVILIGDGVSAEVRSVAMDLCRSDPRVMFLDLPKGPNHGEAHRDRAITESGSDAIFYLCDDDLLLPKHVENLLALLSEADLVQSRNGCVDTGGRLVLFPTDLGDRECVEWHLKSPRRNATSLTGTAHRRSTYLDLPEGWTTTPTDEWPDHYMWKKFLRVDGFRGATHSEMTALQLPTSAGREQVDQEHRVEELARWARRLAEPGAHEWLQGLANTAAAAQLAACSRQVIDLGHEVTRLGEEGESHRRELLALHLELGRRGSELEERRSEIAERDQEIAALAHQMAEVELRLSGLLVSRSWRLTAPLRRLAEGPGSSRWRMPR